MLKQYQTEESKQSNHQFSCRDHLEHMMLESFWRQGHINELLSYIKYDL